METNSAPRSVGQVFTKRWVVEMILDFVGYTPDKDLASKVILEPSCGDGAFLTPIVERLVESMKLFGRTPESAVDAISAFEIQEHQAQKSRTIIQDKLVAAGFPTELARKTAYSWIAAGDFILSKDRRMADYVVGNPPYVRLEDIDDNLRNEYRSACRTMTGRADLYIGFIEHGLSLLNEQGKLGYICADRWMRNQYGRKIRSQIASLFALETVVKLHDADVFDEDVSAYPSVVVISRQRSSESNVVHTNQHFTNDSATELVNWIRDGKSGDAKTKSFKASRVNSWFRTDDPWPDGNPETIEILQYLQNRFDKLESPRTTTRIGIGIATGADAVFVTSNPNLVENDRLLQLSMVRDLQGDKFQWNGYFLVNPWQDDGQLVDLSKYPLLAAYLDSNRAVLERRNVASKYPHNWYRTIDKVRTEIINEPKLLIPDMKAYSAPVLELGGFYPHHNLYYVTSSVWDLSVLGGLLLSKIAESFIRSYGVEMRGGTLRFQAQNLRQICVPNPDSISDEVASDLALAFRKRDKQLATHAASKAYELSKHQSKVFTDDTK